MRYIFHTLNQNDKNNGNPAWLGYIKKQEIKWCRSYTVRLYNNVNIIRGLVYPISATTLFYSYSMTN